MDFIIGIPRTKRQHDSIVLVLDKPSKYTHFILVKSTYKAINIIEIFMKETSKIHGIPKTITSDRDAKLTSNLWKALFVGMEKKTNFNNAYHP